MPGLEMAVFEVAREAGIPLALGIPQPWLTGRGHLSDLVQQRAPTTVLETLADVHQAMGGDAAVLASKRPGRSPTPDLVHVPTGQIIEVDEVQHFTTAREISLLRYPTAVPLGFDVSTYLQLIGVWRPKADRAFAHKVSADFPNPGGRQAQRAYNDALRDLLAPTFTGLPILRIPVPDRTLDEVGDLLGQAFGPT